MKQKRLTRLTPFLFTVKKYLPGSLFWGIFLGGIVAVNAIGTTKAGINLGQFAASLIKTPGLFALFGQFHALDTIEGYAVWKTFVISTVVMGIWGILTSGQLFRGDEEEGRLEL